MTEASDAGAHIQEAARAYGIEVREVSNAEPQTLVGVVDGLAFHWHQADGFWRLQIASVTANTTVAGVSTPATAGEFALTRIALEVRRWAEARECPRDHAARKAEGDRFCGRCGTLLDDELTVPGQGDS